MVFRLPTPFESFVPTSISNSQSRPWRGSFTLHGIDLFHGIGRQQKLYVASAETEGNNRIDIWPKQFNVYVTRQSCRLSDIQAWVRSHGTPLCMFMPDRQANGPDTRNNDAHFRSLARSMMDNQIICIAPWNDPVRMTGSGIIILPTSSSTGLLIGAIFLDGQFPEFLFSDTSRPSGAVLSGLPSTSPFPLAFPMTGPSPAAVSPGQRSMSTPPQRHYGAMFGSPYQVESKPPLDRPSLDRPFSPVPFVRQPQAVTPFNWPFVEDSSDGSGHTSPGSVYGWQ